MSGSARSLNFPTTAGAFDETHNGVYDAYVAKLSATTGMPISYCKKNAEKIRDVLADMETILSGLTRGMDLGILDRGYGMHSSEPRASARADAPWSRRIEWS